MSIRRKANRAVIMKKKTMHRDHNYKPKRNNSSEQAALHCLFGFDDNTMDSRRGELSNSERTLHDHVSFSQETHSSASKDEQQQEAEGLDFNRYFQKNALLISLPGYVDFG